MDISKQKTPIVVAIAVLWLVCVMLGSTGHFVWGMVLGVPLIGLHFMLGVARQGVVSRRFFRFCIIPWAVLMAATFILCGYYADLFKGVMPGFSILGMHPSFAPVILTYWLGGLLTVSLGYYLLRQEWLSEQEWDAFCKRAKDIRDRRSEDISEDVRDRYSEGGNRS